MSPNAGRFSRRLPAVLLLLLAPWARAVASQETSSEPFEMLYEDLAAPQKALVEDWIHRYGESRSETLGPEVYDQLPLSVKTTFGAVTNALMKTALTDKDSGKPIADDAGEQLTAMDLVAKLDAVKGKVKGASGDEQFRMYVQLIPDAVEILEDSAEFDRRADNTVFHKGYPQNFRSTTGVPSIQFSIAVNGQQADIDIDYRSSKFPAALLNGHLSSANSDVRAGDNYQRHSRLWTGLQDWWSGWEGLGDWFQALYGARGLDIPATERKGKGPVEDAAHDFLQTWLVEQRPDVAMSYLSKDVYRCLDDPDSADADASIEQRMYRKMQETNRVIGAPRNLANVVQGVTLTSLGMQYEQNRYHSLFATYPVPPDRAVEFECAFRNLSIPKARLAQIHQSGEYALTTFFLKSGEMRGVTAALLWSRQPEGWKLSSFELEPAVGLVPDLHAPPFVPAARGDSGVKADPDFVRANDEFMNAWFVQKDYPRALSFLSPESFRCLDAFGESEPGADSPADPRTRFQKALETVSEFLGDVDRKTLPDAIAGVEPWSPLLRDVTLPGGAATLVAVPEGESSEYRCTAGPADEDSSRPQREAPSTVYGNYFGSAFRLKLANGEHAGSIFTLWQRVEGAWKVVGLRVLDD